MNKGVKVIIYIFAAAGLLLGVFGCINLYAASFQEQMPMAAVALTLVVALGVTAILWQAKKHELGEKQVVICTGLGFVVPQALSMALSWDSAQSFFICNIALMAAAVVLSAAVISRLGKLISSM